MLYRIVGDLKEDLNDGTIKIIFIYSMYLINLKFQKKIKKYYLIFIMIEKYKILYFAFIKFSLKTKLEDKHFKVILCLFLLYF